MTDAQDALVFLIRRLHEYIVKRVEEGKEQKDMIKILIPNCYVTKLIGKGSKTSQVGGNQIREIAARACGAQIKICSNLEQEKERQECIVTVAGNLANKQDAVCIILEVIEEINLNEVSCIYIESTFSEEYEEKISYRTL